MAHELECAPPGGHSERQCGRGQEGLRLFGHRSKPWCLRETAEIVSRAGEELVSGHPILPPFVRSMVQHQSFGHEPPPSVASYKAVMSSKHLLRERLLVRQTSRRATHSSRRRRSALGRMRWIGSDDPATTGRGGHQTFHCHAPADSDAPSAWTPRASVGGGQPGGA